MFSTAALAIAFVEENIAYGHGYTVAGQTAGNLHLAVKVSLAVLIIGIGQLACQSIQCIVNSFRINSQALIAGNQINNGILLRMFDDGVACINGYAVACMLIENIRVATVVINRQRTAFLLEDIASSLSSCTTGQLRNMAASELFTLIYVCQSSLLLISPGCTVFQPQVCCSGKELAVTPLRYGLAAFRELVIYNTSKLGVLRGQAKINFSFRAAVNIVYSAAGYYHVTSNINLIISSTDYIALCILNGIHVDSTAG